MTSITAKLSVIILFKEKNKQLQKAIESASFAKEIITLQNKEITNFAEIRNQALKKATQEWVFFLDSDEIISQESIAEIIKIIQEDSLDGVIINRQDVFYGRLIEYGEAGKTKLLRMGKKEKMSWQRPVHEVAQITGIVGDSKIKITHYAHNSLDDFLDSVVNYAQLEAAYKNKLQQPVSLLKLIIFPIGKFIYNYLLKKGFKDGWPGLSYALIMSLHSFSVRVFQYELKYNRNYE